MNLLFKIVLFVSPPSTIDWHTWMTFSSSSLSVIPHCFPFSVLYVLLSIFISFNVVISCSFSHRLRISHQDLRKRTQKFFGRSLRVSCIRVRMSCCDICFLKETQSSWWVNNTKSLAVSHVSTWYRQPLSSRTFKVENSISSNASSRTKWSHLPFLKLDLFSINFVISSWPSVQNFIEMVMLLLNPMNLFSEDTNFSLLSPFPLGQDFLPKELLYCSKDSRCFRWSTHSGGQRSSSTALKPLLISRDSEV